jgi:predicted nucleic acid-binding protein
MARYLLDTTTLIDFSKGLQPVVVRLVAMLEAGEDFGVCAIVVGEFFTGLSATERILWRTFIDSLAYWDIPREAAVRAGEDRYRLARQGLHISITDALIAATARAHGAVIITDNPRHYPPENVPILSLRAPAP